jgi:hypothetical protein
MGLPDASVIIPVYQEVQSVPKLHRRHRSVVTPLGPRDVEIAADLSGEEVVHFAVARDR